MYGKHPDLEEPPSNAIIWRYMTLPKFIDMLDKSSLYFVRSDQFQDVFEGKYTQKNLENIKNHTKSHHATIKENLNFTELVMKNFLRINCWTVSNYESALLWERYINNNGVAVQSTFNKLIKSFDNTPETINAGIVKYRDNQLEAVPTTNGYYLLTNKKKLYEDEKELRLFRFLKAPNGTLNFNDFPIGCHIKFDMDVAIEKIILSPSTPTWHLENVQSLLHKYGMTKNVILSELDSKPPT